MDVEPWEVEVIRENADALVGFARDSFGVALGFDPDGVAWLDGFIEQRRPGLSPVLVTNLVLTTGAFLGECLCRCYGGRWVRVEDRWGVRFASGATVFPLAKARKHVECGPGDSVLSLFQAIPEFLRAGGSGRTWRRD